jgi:hypothetical protein
LAAERMRAGANKRTKKIRQRTVRLEGAGRKMNRRDRASELG